MYNYIYISINMEYSWFKKINPGTAEWDLELHLQLWKLPRASSDIPNKLLGKAMCLSPREHNSPTLQLKC